MDVLVPSGRFWCWSDPAPTTAFVGFLLVHLPPADPFVPSTSDPSTETLQVNDQGGFPALESAPGMMLGWGWSYWMETSRVGRQGVAYQCIPVQPSVTCSL